MDQTSANPLASFTRPADTTQYSVNDVVGTLAGAVQEFTNAARFPGGGGVIRGLTFTKSDDDLTGAAFDLYLFTAAPTAIADNAAFAITDAERLTLVAFVELLAADGRASGTGNEWSKTNLDIPFVCASGSRSLYGVLVARGTYTPASAEVIGERLLIRQD